MFKLIITGIAVFTFWSLHYGNHPPLNEYVTIMFNTMIPIAWLIAILYT